MEYKLLALALILNTVCVESGEISPRIASGTRIAYNISEEFWNTVMIMFKHDTDTKTPTYCSGYLLTEKDVLTAAHCFDTYKFPRTVLITFGPHEFNVLTTNQFTVRVILHPDYSPDTKANDLAVLKLAEPLENPMFKKSASQNTKCVVMGFGVDENGRPIDDLNPYKKEVTIIECGQPTGKICAVDETSHGVLCPGDTGAPLVCNNELIGIAVSDSSCGTGVSDVYQSVKEMQQWIDDQVGLFTTPASASNIVPDRLTRLATLAVILKLRFYFVLN